MVTDFFVTLTLNLSIKEETLRNRTNIKKNIFMENELKNQVEAVLASVGGLLAMEQFLQNHYLFRRNVLSGKIECATLPAGDEPEYRELTPEAEMSIIIRARKELADEISSSTSTSSMPSVPLSILR
jgi:hypothetical protein